MKWLWISLAALAALVLLVVITGALLPRDHAASRRVRIRQTAATIYAAITDVAAMPSWRRELKSVEVLPPRDGKPCWREVSSFGPMDVMLEVAEPSVRVVTRIVTEGSPFGGTWTFRLTEREGATDVTITENGEIHNVVFRALTRFVFGHASTIEGYLRALAAKFGEAAVLEPAPPEPAPPAAK